jgi:hypothetical protein
MEPVMRPAGLGRVDQEGSSDSGVNGPRGRVTVAR